MFSEAPNNPGICDRCAMRYDRRDLFLEAETKARVCEECLDQPRPKPIRLRDTTALRWARPDQPENPDNLIPFVYPDDGSVDMG